MELGETKRHHFLPFLVFPSAPILVSSDSCDIFSCVANCPLERYCYWKRTHLYFGRARACRGLKTRF